MHQLAPHTRAALDQMVAATRDFWDAVDIDTSDPVQIRAIRATLSGLIWVQQNRPSEMDWWIAAFCESVE